MAVSGELFDSFFLTFARIFAIRCAKLPLDFDPVSENFLNIPQ